MLVKLIEEFANAIGYLTLFPIGKSSMAKGFSEERPGFLFFPLVGFLLGLLSLWIFALTSSFLPPRVGYLLLILSPEFLSRGLHLQSILRFENHESSKVGASGILAVFAILMMKYELIQVLTLQSHSFLFALAFSRWSLVASQLILPVSKRGPSLKRDFVFATFSILLIMLFLGWAGLFTTLVVLSFLCFLLFLASRFSFARKIDLMDSSCELTELLVYIAMAVIL
ncbi:MAG: adenosylcobinamide-GDP ribazoletransferase [Candidatus Omnitrophica bacterium]|nr:adenosylcobinamide-GDP ribazoletransferase [Candidatus Omnitrophota bacterium]